MTAQAQEPLQFSGQKITPAVADGFNSKVDAAPEPVFVAAVDIVQALAELIVEVEQQQHPEQCRTQNHGGVRLTDT